MYLKDTNIYVSSVSDDSTLSSPPQERSSHKHERDTGLVESLRNSSNDVHENLFAGAIGNFGWMLGEELIRRGHGTASHALNNLTMSALIGAELCDLVI